MIDLFDPSPVSSFERPNENKKNEALRLNKNCHASLILYLVNATSLAKPSAVDLLTTELSQSLCHGALIVETWFTAKHLSSVVAIAGFDLYRRDRKSGRGGGVCVHILEMT